MDASCGGVVELSHKRSLLSLADRVQSEGPSRELDAEIALALGWRLDRGMWWAPTADPIGCCLDLPPFTASLDAAVTLLPKGWVVLNIFQDLQPPHRFQVRLARMCDRKIVTASADWLTQALPAAALRALAEEG